jgi:hypothetical protein
VVRTTAWCGNVDDSDNRIPAAAGPGKPAKDTQSDEAPGVRLSDLMQSLVGMTGRNRYRIGSQAAQRPARSGSHE